MDSLHQDQTSLKHIPLKLQEQKDHNEKLNILQLKELPYTEDLDEI